MKLIELKIGNLVMADFKGIHSKKCIITGLNKDNTVKVLDLESKEEDIVPVSKCYGITVTESTLTGYLQFERHTVNLQLNSSSTSSIEEYIKVLLAEDDEHVFWFLKIPENKTNGMFVLVIEDSNRTELARVNIMYVHEMQNIVSQVTKNILC